MRWGGTQRVLSVLAANVVIFSAVWNCRTLRRYFLRRSESGYENILSGEPFTQPYHAGSSRVRIPVETISPGSKVFFWEEQRPEFAVSTECRAIVLNYYLYPSTVAYLNPAEMAESDFVVMGVSAKRSFLEYTGRMSGENPDFPEFRPVRNEDRIIIMERVR